MNRIVYNDSEPMKMADLPPLTSPATSRRTPFEWAVMVLGCELAAINVGLGLTLLMALPSRTSAASFDPIKELMPIEAWGWCFLVTGAMAVLAQSVLRLELVGVAHLSAGMFCLFWAIAFYEGLSNPLASATGIWAYAGLAATHITVASTTIVVALRRGRSG